MVYCDLMEYVHTSMIFVFTYIMTQIQTHLQLS